MSYYTSVSPPTQQPHPPPPPPPSQLAQQQRVSAPQMLHAFPPNMQPHGGLYPAVGAHLEQMQQQQQQFVQFQQQQQLAAASMVSQPISHPVALGHPQQQYTPDALLAAHNLVAQNMDVQNITQNMAAQSLTSQSMATARPATAAAGAAADHPSPASTQEEIADLGDIGLQDLLHGINPDMFGELQSSAPDVIALLTRKSNTLAVAPSNDQVPAITFAPTNASAIDPGAIPISQMITQPTVPRMPHEIQPTPKDTYPYLAGMVDATAPMVHAPLNVPCAAPPTRTSPQTNLASRRTANHHRPNGARTGNPVAVAAAAAAAGSAAASVAKASRPRAGQKRAKTEHVSDPQTETLIKQEMTPMTGVYDNASTGAGDMDLSDCTENSEVRRAMRAERNRQSAAASRERKKNHIKELERRVASLSRLNAKMQMNQLDAVRVRIEKEQELLDQNKMLVKDGLMKDLKIHELTHKLEKAGVDPPTMRPAIRELNLKRPSTWGSSTWSTSIWGKDHAPN